MATSKLKVKPTEANEVSNSNSLKVKKSTEGEGENPVEPDMQKIKADWNKYLDYLEEKGVKGSPELDKGGLGNKYFQEYIKANPETSLSASVIPKIREAYKELRNVNIEQIKKGKSVYKNEKTGKEYTGESVDFSDFMPHIVKNEQTKDPNYVGQHLTKTPFPSIRVGGKVVASSYTPEQSKNAREVIKKSN